VVDKRYPCLSWDLWPSDHLWLLWQKTEMTHFSANPHLRFWVLKTRWRRKEDSSRWQLTMTCPWSIFNPSLKWWEPWNSQQCPCVPSCPLSHTVGGFPSEPSPAPLSAFTSTSQACTQQSHLNYSHFSVTSWKSVPSYCSQITLRERINCSRKKYLRIFLPVTASLKIRKAGSSLTGQKMEPQNQISWCKNPQR
jgi:hypothetical protein